MRHRGFSHGVRFFDRPAPWLLVGILLLVTPAVADCARLEPLHRVGGDVEDFDADRLLYFLYDLTILDLATGEFTVTPAPSFPPWESPDEAFLAPHGAIFEWQDDSLWDWSDGVVSEIGHVSHGASFRVSGDYAIWNDAHTLMLRDLQAGMNEVVATNVTYSPPDVAANGAVVYRDDVEDEIYFWKDGVAEQWTDNPDPVSNTAPLTDGTRAVFVRFVWDTWALTLLSDGAAEVVLARWTADQLGDDFVEPGEDYRIRDGWVAFTRPADGGRREVWLRSPSGEENLLAPDGEITSLAPQGTVTFFADDGLHVAGPDRPACLVEAPFPVSSYSTEPYWIGGELLLLFHSGADAVFTTGIIDGCVDSDFDGFCAGDDCDDGNPHCNVDCDDLDLDGYCASSDCDPVNPSCNLDCADADGDGFCVTTDCDDASPYCTTLCEDRDGDGVAVCAGDCDDGVFCLREDCAGPVPVCGSFCRAGSAATDRDSDGDGRVDCLDTCPLVPDDASDADGNGVGDACDCGFSVDTTEDGDDGECVQDCTLREALSLISSGCGLRVPAGTYPVTLGPLRVNRSLSLRGDGADRTILEGRGSGVLEVGFGPFGPVNAFVGGMTITGGEADEGGGIDVERSTTGMDLILSHAVVRDNHARYDPGAGLYRGRGGGISVAGGTSSQLQADVTLSHCTVLGNRADKRGGGVFVGGGKSADGGRLVVRHSTIADNWTDGPGGGIYAEGGGDPYFGGVGAWVSLEDTTLAGNFGTEGGALCIDGAHFPSNEAIGARAFLYRCLLRDNTAEAGAGVFVESGPVPFAAGEFNADNSTLDGNLGTGGGGAVWVAGGDDPDSGGAVLLRNSTISHNSAATAGGIRSQTDGSPWVVISYTVLAGNGDGTGSPDCRGTVFSGGRNLLQDPDGCDFFPTSSDLTYVDPLLGPLLDNGGPTETRAPQPDSPAVDTPSFSCLPVDQRGVPRSQGSGCDIGAVELAFDSDGDGVPDLLDGCPLDPDKSEPGVCGCGVPEVGGDADLDGLADCVDPCPDDPDVDGDGFSRFGGCPAGHPADCDDANSATFPGAAERNDGLDNQCPGDPGHGVIDETSGNSGFHDPDDESRYSWPPQAGAESYEVARASSPDFFTECTVFAASADTFVVDITEPPPGVAFFYMNHAVTPHVGSWGQRSNGQERVVPCDIR